MGSILRSSVSRLARACRSAASVGAVDVGGACSLTLTRLRFRALPVAGTRVEAHLQPRVAPKIDRGAEDEETPGPAA
jgi:hypothetical protein